MKKPWGFKGHFFQNPGQNPLCKSVKDTVTDHFLIFTPTNL